jgi:hypothetical protein
MPVVNSLFPRLLYKDILAVSDEYNNAIRQEIERIHDTGNIERETKTFISNAELISNTTPASPNLNILRTIIKEHINIFAEIIGRGKKYDIVDMWASVAKKGQHHAIHAHGPIHLAGVYYVQVPTDQEFSIDFMCPNTFLLKQSHNEEIKSKTLVLFDGALSHGFDPNPSDTRRIILAFNALEVA